MEDWEDFLEQASLKEYRSCTLVVDGEIYEQAGVEEYWIVFPQGKSVEIYYLTEGKYVLAHSYILQDDEEEKDYNAKTEISLKGFPHITMKLEDIFEGMDP